MMYTQYNPYGFFENAKDGVCEVKTFLLASLGATANQSVIAAVTGKRIRVIRFRAYSAGIASDITFRSASGGTQIASYYIPANTVAEPNVIEADYAGVMETNAGEALVVSVAAAVSVVISGRYIEYTP